WASTSCHAWASTATQSRWSSSRSGRGSRSTGRGFAPATSAGCAVLPSTSRASLPTALHLLDQPFHVLDTGHHGRHGAGGGKLAQLVLLQRRRLATGPLDLQGQRPAPISADQVRQAPSVRPAVGLDDVRALGPQETRDGLRNRGLGGHLGSPRRAASGNGGNSGNGSGNTEIRFRRAFAGFVPTVPTLWRRNTLYMRRNLIGMSGRAKNFPAHI